MSEEAKRYAFPVETLPGLRMGDHLGDLLEFKEFLEIRGIRTSNTRIDRYCECLRRIIAGDERLAPAVFDKHPTETFGEYGDYVLYLLREVHELMWILKGLRKYQPPGLDEKLREIVSGTDFAALDSNSVSRNTQFELRIASYFCQSGLEVDLSKGTDVIAYDDRVAFYLECKRVASSGQLDRRMGEARKQLRNRMPKKAGNRVVYGCVAVDVTKVAFQHNGVTWAMTNEHSRDVIQEKLIEIAGGLNSDAIFRSVGGLLHYWLQIHMPALIRYPGTIATRISSYHIFREGLGRKERRAVDRFIEVFEGVSRADERAHPSVKLAHRREMNLPAGTKFDFDEALIAEWLQGGEIARRDPESIVGRLEVEGVEHEFSFFEFDMTAPTFAGEALAELASNPIQAGFVILAQMLYMRDPYERNPTTEQGSGEGTPI